MYRPDQLLKPAHSFVRMQLTAALRGWLVPFYVAVLGCCWSVVAGSVAWAGPYIDAVQWLYWDEVPHFKRVAEYFTGHEYTPGKAVLRTDAQQRAGWYCTVFLKQALGLQRHADAQDKSQVGRPCTVRVHYWPAGQPDPQLHDFVLPCLAAVAPAPCAKGYRLLELGFTAQGWPPSALGLLAWRVELLDADGKLLDNAQSYLWE
jgi:hypothetical protein